MNPKELQEISKHLRLLYVEDDDNLREETSKLFSHLFNKIEIAEDGEIGLAKYKAGNFDLIISDINMPNMNGVEMVKKIREINPDEPIIITSAHDEASYLLPLIDAGIDKYILKPINMQSMMSVLATVCKNIKNARLVEEYKEELELKNDELTRNNDKLFKMIRILDSKIKNQRIAHPSEHTKSEKSEDVVEAVAPKKAAEEETPSIQTFEDYILDNDLSEMKELEEDIEANAVSLQMQNSANEPQVVKLGQEFSAYGTILSHYPVFSLLGSSIAKMGVALSE